MWYRYKYSLYRRKLLGPCSELFLFTDIDCFNLEAPLSFSSSALCVIDSFLLSATGYQSLWLGHQYVNYWIFVLLIWWRNSIIWDLQPLLCPLPHLKVRTNTLWENFIILLIYFWNHRICLVLFFSRTIGQWFSKASMCKPCQEFALTSCNCPSAKGTVTYKAALN